MLATSRRFNYWTKTYKVEISLFEECYKVHLHRIIHFANGYIHDMPAANDIASEVFTQVWKDRAKIDFTSDMLPFLLVLTRNRCVNYLKRIVVEKKYESMSNQDDMTMMINYSSLAEASCLTQLYSKEIEAILFNSIDQMPEKVKNTFILNKFKDMKYRDIAEKQNVSVKTIEKRMTNAFKILRTNLKDYLSA